MITYQPKLQVFCSLQNKTLCCFLGVTYPFAINYLFCHIWIIIDSFLPFLMEYNIMSQLSYPCSICSSVTFPQLLSVEDHYINLWCRDCKMFYYHCQFCNEQEGCCFKNLHRLKGNHMRGRNINPI